MKRNQILLLIMSIVLFAIAPFWGHAVGMYVKEHNWSYTEGLYVFILPWLGFFSYWCWVLYSSFEFDHKTKKIDNE